MNTLKDDLPKPWVPQFRVGDKVIPKSFKDAPAWKGKHMVVSHVDTPGAPHLYCTENGLLFFKDGDLEPYVEPSPAQKMVAKTLEIFRIQQDGLEVKMTLTYQLSAEEGRPKGIGRTEAAAIQDLKDITP